MFPKNLRLTNPAGSVVIFSALKIFWLNIPMFLSGRLTLRKARKAVQSFSPFISSSKDCSSLFSENAMIHNLSLTFSTACISNCFLIVSSLFFLSCWRITAVNFQTLPRLNWTPREIGEQICSTAMPVLLIRKEAARTTMNWSAGSFRKEQISDNTHRGKSISWWATSTPILARSSAIRALMKFSSFNMAKRF